MLSDAMLPENECCLLTPPLTNGEVRSELPSNKNEFLVPLLTLPLEWDMGSGLTPREDVWAGSGRALDREVCFGDLPFSSLRI